MLSVCFRSSPGANAAEIYIFELVSEQDIIETAAFALVALGWEGASWILKLATINNGNWFVSKISLTLAVIAPVPASGCSTGQAFTEGDRQETRQTLCKVDTEMLENDPCTADGSVFECKGYNMM